MNDDKLEQILNSIGAEEIPAEAHRIAQDASNNFSKSLRQPSQPAKPSLLELIMRSRTTKLAAAAVIVIAALVTLPFVGDRTSGVVLADVLVKVEQAQAFMYKMKMNITGSMMPGAPGANQDMQGIIVISNKYGMKMEMELTDPTTGQKMTQQMYILPEQRTALMIVPQQQTYTRMEFTDDLLDRMEEQNYDPREMIKRTLNCKYTGLGRSVIDGVEVEGFRTTDPALYAGAMGDANVALSLWVDAETWLPVRAEMDVEMSEQMKMHAVMCDYQWDIAVEQKDFEPVIPENFKPFPPEGMKIPEGNEEGAIEGLRLFIELAGKYPEDLSLMTLVQQTVGLQDSNSVRAEQFRRELEQAGSEEAKAAKIMDMTRPIQSLGMFYMALVQDKKEPVYHGKSIRPDDVGAVLLRWKTAENEYRVIFGDLSVLTVTAEKLKELEK